MFITRFPTTKFSSIRVGTITTRNQSCAAMTGIAQVAKVVGKTTLELLMYTPIRAVASEVLSISKPEQELDKIHSYARYMIPMNLVTKSPYSTTANPSLHLFIHSVGTAAGSLRSRNARMVGEGNSMSIIHCGIFIGSRLATSTDIKRQFVDAADEAQEIGDDYIADAGDDFVLEPGDLIQELTNFGGELPNDVLLRIRQKMGAYDRPRANTIGLRITELLEGINM